MKSGRIETLVSWLWTGTIFVGVGLFFLVRGWFMSEVGMPQVEHRGAILDSKIALAGAAVFVGTGLVIIAAAIIRRLRVRRSP